MTNGDWQLLQTAFQQVLPLQGEARRQFVETFGRTHPGLVNELEALLAADSADNGDLALPIRETARQLTADTKDPWLGRRVGAWTITRRLASGGMGAVFLAERADQQYEQTVAVKVMGSQLLATAAIDRFRAERQILARLSHPFIARLIDGGETGEGLPYLVMEYVVGVPIDRYCDDHNLDIDARLRLFTRVCSAVDYAHRNLVVHRDLKPNNILVDEQGNPRLLDFGIAKLLQDGGYRDDVATTREGMRMMTPEYASPEQVRGQPISVASDVYALGVLLYRSLTNQSPYGTMPTSAEDYERAILECEPVRPSTVVTATTSGQDRAAQPARVRKRLRGDLDNIALKCLQKDPERRYPTVNAVAEDILRCLRNEPVEARGDHWLYRSRKFARRHALAVVATAAILVTLVTTVSYHTLRIAEERDRANRAAAEAAQVSGFLTRLFANASTFETRGEDVSAIDLLDRGSEDIGKLDDRPQLQAALYRVMGSSYTSLGRMDASIPMLQAALATQQSAKPPDEAALALTLADLAEAYRLQPDLEAAERLARQVIDLGTRRFGVASDEVATARGRLGVILLDHHERSRTVDGLAELQSAFAAKQALGNGDDADGIDMRGNMANALDALGRYDEAIALHEEAVAMTARLNGEMHPLTVLRLANLGVTLLSVSRNAAAVDALTEAVSRGRRIWPDNHDQLSYMTSALASGLKRIGRFDESLRYYRVAAEMTRIGAGERSPRYVNRLRGIASAYLDLARYEEADAGFRRALALAGEVEVADGAQTAVLNLLLGQSKNDQDQYRQAESYLRESLRLAGNYEFRVRLIARKELATALSGQGKFADAEAIFKDVLAQSEAANGRDTPAQTGYLVAIASHYLRAGNVPLSLDYAARANAIVHAGPLDWRGALAVEQYGDSLRAAGQHAESLLALREAHAVLQATFGDDDPRVSRLAGKTD